LVLNSIVKKIYEMVVAVVRHTYLFLGYYQMNKTLVAFALTAAFTSSAFAQSSVTIYGVADAGLVAESRGVVSGASTAKLTSGVASGSRLGFKGTESLGDGLSAVFVLEGGYSVDTGVSSGAARQSYVGLTSATMGAVTMGRQYTPVYEVLRDVADPFALGTAGSSLNLFTTAGSRANNMVKYATPSFGGFTGSASVAMGEIPGDTAAGRRLSATLGYAAGPLVATVIHTTANDAADVHSAKTSMAAASYDFGVVKANAAFAVNKGDGSVANNARNVSVGQLGTLDSRDFLIGVTAPIGGRSKLVASYIRHDDRTGANGDANQFGIGYIYSMSKRTDLYTAVAQVNNKNGSLYTIGNATEAGSGSRAVNAGVRHSF
jgi:GBP family porin